MATINKQQQYLFCMASLSIWGASPKGKLHTQTHITT
jgi:hypothetical protein